MPRDAMRPFGMGGEVLHHQTDQRDQRHDVINSRPQKGGRDQQEPHREEQQERDTGNHDPIQPDKPTIRHPIDGHHTQGKKQQNRHDIKQPLPDLRQGREGRDNPLMLLGHLAQMHPQPRHEPIQDQFREGDDQDQLNRVPKQQGLIAELPRNPVDGGTRGIHSIHP